MNHAKRIPKIDRMTSARLIIQLVVLIAMIAGMDSPLWAENQNPPVNCQVIVSLMELDEDAPGMEEKNYDLIFFGAAAQKPFYKDTLEYGFETGANLSMENDTNVLSSSAGSSGGTAKVAIDNTWFLFDYFGGGYVAANIASRLRLYAGAGPLLIYGSWEHEPDDNDDEFDDDNESHLSAGVYGRAGIEVAIIERISIGGGVRAVATNLKFDDSLGEIKVEGPQYFFNISFKI